MSCESGLMNEDLAEFITPNSCTDAINRVSPNSCTDTINRVSPNSSLSLVAEVKL